ncbi:MAG: type II toxin-antitoxin system HicB family antitoxin [Desulfovibrio sp.]
MNTLEFNGYVGKFEYDNEADIFHGEVINLRDVITFQGRSIDELKKALKESIEDYLEFCAEEGEEPEKPYSGRFNLRIEPELHRRVAQAAAVNGLSLNKWVEKTLDNAAHS